MIAMLFLRTHKILVACVAVLAVFFVFTFHSGKDEVDFNTQVKPIFNKKCITCHGGVRRKSNFSLLFRSEALQKAESGKYAIIPGDPANSEMIRRLSLTDPEERMPFKHPALSGAEIDLLKRWIKEGAKWGDHWAYLPVKEVALPKMPSHFFGLIGGSKPSWARNDIDYFIYDKLQAEKLSPSAEADKPTLLRRLSLDLTGVPASPSVMESFLNDHTADAYEKLVDTLLASPLFGERWASVWLDVARYADTKGYEADMPRNIWKYRDWVIRAFNRDMPYDRFLTEQIAGDLLPFANDTQLIATAFHRNSMTNDEGGTDNEEFRTAAVIDRVNTTWEGLMGTTFGCVQCHSHPYDPFKHEEYYKFMAYFNNTRDEDVPEDYPLLRDFPDSLQKKLDDVTSWVSRNVSAERARQISLFIKTWQPAINSEKADSLYRSVLSNNNASLDFRNHAIARLAKVDLQHTDQLMIRLYCNFGKGMLTVHADAPDGAVLGTLPVNFFAGWQILTMDYPERQGVHDIYLTYENPTLKEKEDFAISFNWFAFTRQFPGHGKRGYEENKKAFWQLMNADLTGTPVMMENPAGMHRDTYVFERGNWLTKGSRVEPAVPAYLQYAMPAGAPKNRTGLAMWMVSKQNPLVSRTITNRIWEQLFGTGIVETLEDMGTQGIAPTHKDLLDHLSWQLMNDYQWSLKKLIREIVTSATYRQDSKLTDETKQKDLFNKWYARGPRVRLSAEQLRDQDLFLCGMLSKKMYGPGVMPWQPQGIWQSPYNYAQWENSTGEDQYRRAVYTYWKRSSPYPSMMAFDGTQHSLCTARRLRTNTPLQALTTLNDSAYLDMARHFAYRLQQEAGNDVSRQITTAYQLMVYKSITPAKLKVFTELYNQALSSFQGDAEKTCEMVGEADQHNTPQTAAMIIVASAMLNMDEVITKN